MYVLYYVCVHNNTLKNRLTYLVQQVFIEKNYKKL